MPDQDDDARAAAREATRQAALKFHEFPQPGKLEIRPTKPLATPRDLSRAYSPGVAEACLEIQKNPLDASRYTARGNLVAVVSNGTAALGLGDIGPLACKPIMEGKAVLFKKFAHIDCFDIEIAESDPEKLAEHVIALEPTFGAINLEDIKAPDCFVVERICRERMGIPVFHDDQHGTAIVVAAAAKNALHLTGRSFEDIKVVSVGGGAAGIACLNLLMSLGVRRENIWLYDRTGLVTEGRNEGMTFEKQAFAQAGPALPLGDGMKDADLFLGLSGPGVVTAEMVKGMARQPIIFGLANPTPEIMPEEVHAIVDDAIMATGRSDYPNQVNNVLCFPFIFRGALDVGAHGDQRGDEDRLRRRDRRAGAQDDPSRDGGRLRRRDAGLRPRLPHPQTLRPAPPGHRRLLGGPGGDGDGRRDAADRGSRRLSREARRDADPLLHGHAAGVRIGTHGCAPHRLRRRRGRARAAHGLCDDRGDGGRADPDRPARRDRDALRALRLGQDHHGPLRDREPRNPTPAIATTGRPTTSTWRAAASRRTLPAPSCAPTRR